MKRVKLGLLFATAVAVVAPITLHTFLTLGTAMTTSSITWWWQ